jgi:hypothetical protein
VVLLADRTDNDGHGPGLVTGAEKMTKIIVNKKIVRDAYDGHILTCDECGLPFSADEWDERHEYCNQDGIYHDDCCPVCNHDTSPDYTIDTVGGL